MALPDVREKFAAQGAEPGGQSPEDAGAFIQAESAKWKNVIKKANVTLD
jgi:tripartite-type tricarboxylate transporter receptor subunit TctC